MRVVTSITSDNLDRTRRLDRIKEIMGTRKCVVYSDNESGYMTDDGWCDNIRDAKIATFNEMLERTAELSASSLLRYLFVKI